ncbi:hypothetical protein MMC20_008064 [Loxospora ochrophaea]|nr:hypothetical protein [Loxospora ochrophaea]
MVQDPQYYPDPQHFDGFRFARAESQAGGSSSAGKTKLTDITHDWPIWGSSKLPCAGRFYTVMVLKLIITHFLLHHDCSFPAGQPLQPRVWRTWSVPSQKTVLLLRKRAIPDSE